MSKTPEELFWRRVDKSGDCWIWQGGKDKDGYGKFQITMSRFGIPVGWPTPQRHIRAHHFAWELEHGTTSFGELIMHSCDTPACVNVAHMSIGTPKLNYDDAVAKNRHTYGERNSILKSSDVIAILQSTERDAVLAIRFGVKPVTISAIRHRRIWRHIEVSK